MIICGNEDESRSHIVSRMHLYRRAYARAEDSVLKKYLKLHLEQNQHNYPISKRGCVYASSVLEERQDYNYDCDKLSDSSLKP